MRVGQIVLIAALVSAGCASHSDGKSVGPPSPADAEGSPGSGGAGTGGASGSGGSGGGSAGSGGTSSAGGAGGSAGSAGAGSGGMGGDTTPPDAGGPDMPPPITGGKALLITGTIPIVGTDVQFEAALKARGLTVEIIQEKVATPAQAEGARVILLSYGMSSPAFKAEPFTDVPVPIIVTEHFLLPRLKMATPNGFTGKMTKLTFVSDHELAAGFPKG